MRLSSLQENSTLPFLVCILLDKQQIGEAQLKALLSFVVENCHQSSIPNYVVDALWGKTPVLKVTFNFIYKLSLLPYFFLFSELVGHYRAPASR